MQETSALLQAALLKRDPPTLARPLVGQQLVALLAAALEAAHRVPAHVVTPTVVEAALVDVCGQRVIGSTNETVREMHRDKRNSSRENLC